MEMKTLKTECMYGRETKTFARLWLVNVFIRYMTAWYDGKLNHISKICDALWKICFGKHLNMSKSIFLFFLSLPISRVFVCTQRSFLCWGLCVCYSINHLKNKFSISSSCMLLFLSVFIKANFVLNAFAVILYQPKADINIIFSLD